MDLKTFIKGKGYDMTQQVLMQEHITNWESWYKGIVGSFHNYFIYNGTNKVHQKKLSLQMGKKICEDWANLLMNERVEFISEGNEKLLEILDDNDFWVLANQGVEMTFAQGTGAFVVGINDVLYDEETDVFDMAEGKIEIQFVTADKIYPLSFSNGNITECAFVTHKTINGEQFAFVSMHIKENELYVIKNYMLKIKNGNYKDVTDKLADSMQEFKTGMTIPWFGILKPNIINNVVKDSPYGMSIFGNSIDILKALDNVYDSMNNDVQNGRSRIFVSAEMLKIDTEGNQKLTFDANDTTFYQLPTTMDDENMIKNITTDLRITDHKECIETNLNILSSKVGFGERHYKFDSSNIATATQIISENSTLFRTLKKHEVLLENCLYELFEAIMEISNKFLGGTFDLNSEITIDFDDSIIEDKNTEMARDLILVNSGIMEKWEYRMKHLGEDEETAKKSVPATIDNTGF